MGSVMADYGEITIRVLDMMSAFFLLGLGFLVVTLGTFFVIDINQSKDAVRRNFPVLGRFRRIFSMLGEFFRQYFFAMDREEMPFNRAERDWVEKSSSGDDNTVAFGSSKVLTHPGTPIFVNCPFPTLDDDAEETPALVIGPYSRQPYEASSLINISAMMVT
jgi:hypothetical protein